MYTNHTIFFIQVDSGLKDDLVLGDPTAPRFVLWDGGLKPVPSSPSDLPTFDLMSLSGKLRAGFGALGLRPPPPVCTHIIHLYFYSTSPCFLHSNKGYRIVRNLLKSLFAVILAMKFLNA